MKDICWNGGRRRVCAVNFVSARSHQFVIGAVKNEDFIFEVIIDEVRVALKEEILLGYPVKVNVQKCEAGCDCYRQP